MYIYVYINHATCELARTCSSLFVPIAIPTISSIMRKCR